MVPSWPHGIIAAVFIIVAAFVGLKGIQYVARVATYLPLIPVIVGGGAGGRGAGRQRQGGRRARRVPSHRRVVRARLPARCSPIS